MRVVIDDNARGGVDDFSVNTIIFVPRNWYWWYVPQHMDNFVFVEILPQKKHKKYQISRTLEIGGEADDFVEKTIIFASWNIWKFDLVIGDLYATICMITCP